MLTKNSPESIKKCRYQLSEKLAWGTFDHIINQLIKHGATYGKDYIVKGGNHGGYAVYTEGREIRKIS